MSYMYALFIECDNSMEAIVVSDAKVDDADMSARSTLVEGAKMAANMMERPGGAMM